MTLRHRWRDQRVVAEGDRDGNGNFRTSAATAGRKSGQGTVTEKEKDQKEGDQEEGDQEEVGEEESDQKEGR